MKKLSLLIIVLIFVSCADKPPEPLECYICEYEYKQKHEWVAEPGSISIPVGILAPGHELVCDMTPSGIKKRLEEKNTEKVTLSSDGTYYTTDTRIETCVKGTREEYFEKFYPGFPIPKNP